MYCKHVGIFLNKIFAWPCWIFELLLRPWIFCFVWSNFFIPSFSPPFPICNRAGSALVWEQFFWIILLFFSLQSRKRLLTFVKRIKISQAHASWKLRFKAHQKGKICGWMFPTAGNRLQNVALLQISSFFSEFHKELYWFSLSDFRKLI